jgi:hypothetical protein
MALDLRDLTRGNFHGSIPEIPVTECRTAMPPPAARDNTGGKEHIIASTRQISPTMNGASLAGISNHVMYLTNSHVNNPANINIINCPSIIFLIVCMVQSITEQQQRYPAEDAEPG